MLAIALLTLSVVALFLRGDGENDRYYCLVAFPMDCAGQWLLCLFRRCMRLFLYRILLVPLRNREYYRVVLSV